MTYQIAYEVHSRVISRKQNEHEHEMGQETTSKLEHIKEVEWDIRIQACPNVKHHRAYTVRHKLKAKVICSQKKVHAAK